MVPFVAVIFTVAIVDIQSAAKTIRKNRKRVEYIKKNREIFEQGAAFAKANGAIFYDASRDYFLTEKGEIFDEWRKD